MSVRQTLMKRTLDQAARRRALLLHNWRTDMSNERRYKLTVTATHQEEGRDTRLTMTFETNEADLNRAGADAVEVKLMRIMQSASESFGYPFRVSQPTWDRAKPQD